MAGDWLKFEINTPEKREVLAMTVELGFDDPDLTVGKLLRVWRWFDQQTVNGNADSVTPALLDRLIGVNGITKAMVNVGWMIVSDDGLTLPNFARHNGKTAKSRVLTAVRVANHKGKDKSNDASVTSALPREVKRREDKDIGDSVESSPTKNKGVKKPDGVSDQHWSDLKSVWKTKRKALTETALQKVYEESEKAGVSVDTAIQMIVEGGWQGCEAEWITNKLKSSPSVKIQSRNDGAEWLHPSQGWVSSSNIPMPMQAAA